MIRSGLNVPTPAMPMPDLAVPYAAPRAGEQCQCVFCGVALVDEIVLPKIMANAMPAIPMKGANLGVRSFSIVEPSIRTREAVGSSRSCAGEMEDEVVN